jgi:RNA polymerase sigma-70 factor (ECF subfamily)
MRAVDTPKDEDLLVQYLDGNERSFSELVRRHSKELFQFIYRFTNQAAAAEDIVQDAFLQVHLSAGGFDPSRKFRPWLYTIAANKARDFLRSRSRRPEMPLDAQISGDGELKQTFSSLLADAGPTAEVGLEVEDRVRVVGEIIEKMPENFKEILNLAYFHRFSYKDMADILNIPLGTVKSRLHSAVAAFAEAYQSAVTHREDRAI